MSRCYIFHGDQVTEYTSWFLHDGYLLGSYSFEPEAFFPDQRWGQVTQTKRESALPSEMEFNFIDDADVPTAVPKLYLTMALLLT